MQKTPGLFLGREDPLEEGTAIHPSIFAWRIPIDRGAWWAAVHRVTKSDMTERLSAHTHKATICQVFNKRLSLLLSDCYSDHITKYILPSPTDRHGDWNPGRLDDFPKVTQQGGGGAEEPGSKAAPDANYPTMPRPPLAASFFSVIK